MENQIVRSKKDTFNGFWFANRDGLLLQNAVEERSEARPVSSRSVEETEDGANPELNLRLEECRKERARIARELHDSLFQGFFSASMVLQAAVEELPANSPSKSSLSRALDLMRRVIDDGRAVLQGLRSPGIASTSLEQAIVDFRNEFPFTSADFRILVSGHRQALNPSIQEQIYLIAREALANAFHHSNATRIEAEVDYLPAKLRVVIRDDGCGIDPQAARSRENSHWGVLGMHERARSIGAHLGIWSKPGLGTEVEVSVREAIKQTKIVRLEGKHK